MLNSAPLKLNLGVFVISKYKLQNFDCTNVFHENIVKIPFHGSTAKFLQEHNFWNCIIVVDLLFSNPMDFLKKYARSIQTSERTLWTSWASPLQHQRGILKRLKEYIISKVRLYGKFDFKNDTSEKCPTNCIPSNIWYLMIKIWQQQRCTS